LESFKPKKKKGPERLIQDKIIKRLRYLEWYVKETHGNMFQSGFPDLFACHHKYGQRWIEVKLPGMVGSKFTGAQLEDFPKLCANGSPVWVLTGDSDDEVNKLFKPHNWASYLDIWKPSYE
jgi:hypothetical protein